MGGCGGRVGVWLRPGIAWSVAWVGMGVEAETAEVVKGRKMPVTCVVEAGCSWL